MKTRILLLALVIGAYGGTTGRADEKPTTLPAPKEAAALKSQPTAAEPCNTCGTCVSRSRKIWEWVTYRSCAGCACRGTGCNGPAMPPLYTYFLDCHGGCQSTCERSAPSCESTGWRAPALWFTTWSDPGKLLRPAP